MNTDYKTQSIGSIIARKIVDLAGITDKNNILDEINIYGTSDKDGAATMSFEWLGENSPALSNDILEFLNKIKSMLCSTGNKIVEQEPPSIGEFSGITRVLYRFKVWPTQGAYEHFFRELMSN